VSYRFRAAKSFRKALAKLPTGQKRSAKAAFQIFKKRPFRPPASHSQNPQALCRLRQNNLRSVHRGRSSRHLLHRRRDHLERGHRLSRHLPRLTAAPLRGSTFTPSRLPCFAVVALLQKPRCRRLARSRSGIARAGARPFAAQPRINLLPVEIDSKDHALRGSINIPEGWGHKGQVHRHRLADPHLDLRTL